MAATNGRGRPARGERRGLASVNANRRRVLALVALLTVVAIVAPLLRRADRQPAPPAVVRRADPAADLLGWLPSTPETRRAFAVWAGDGAIGTPSAAAGSATPATAPNVRYQQTLQITPFPLTLGLTSVWRERFGYGASDVRRWAVGGTLRGGIAVLDGAFDVDAVRQAFVRAGYRRTTYRGASLFVLSDVATPGRIVGGDATGAANAAALLAGRIITAADRRDVEDAIDSATGRGPSLADDPVVASLLGRLGAVTGVMAIDAADQAVACGEGGGAVAAPVSPAGRYVALAFGHGPAGERTTRVAVALPDERSTAAAIFAYESGWRTGRVRAGSASADIAALGRVRDVFQTGPLVVAELSDGRAAGWVPAAIRFADPVCAAVASAAPTPPPASPTPAPAAGAAMIAAISSLPDAGADGELLAADLAATKAAHGVVFPRLTTGTPAASDLAAWLASLGPLPSFSIFPREATDLSRWPATFGLAPDTIDVVAEARSVDRSLAPTVGVLAGRWDPNRVALALKTHGYASIERGTATHFARLSDDPRRVGGAAWDNVALLGDRIFVSPSIQALRAAVDGLSGYAPAPTLPPSLPARQRLLQAAPGATAVDIVGAGAAQRTCASQGITGQAPDWIAFAAIWIADGAGDRAAIAILPTAGASIPSRAADLDARIHRARTAPPGRATPSPATPVPSRPLAEAFGYLGIERNDVPGQTTVLAARFALPADAPAAVARSFFDAAAGGCQFIL